MISFLTKENQSLTSSSLISDLQRWPPLVLPWCDRRSHLKLDAIHKMCSSQKRTKPVCFPVLWQCLLPSLQRNSHRDRVTSVVWRSLPAVLWNSVKHTRLEFNGWVNVFFRSYVLYCPVFIYVQVNENFCVRTISMILKISKIYKWSGPKTARKTFSVWEPDTKLSLATWQLWLLITFWQLLFCNFHS